MTDARPRLIQDYLVDSQHWLGFPVYPDWPDPMRLVIRDGHAVLYEALVARDPRPFICLPMLDGVPSRRLTLEFWEAEVGEPL